MREIKFRGRRANGEWVTGFLEPGGKHYSIIQFLEKKNGKCEFWSPASVSIETVGQYTGIKDKNGVEIFEGDIVRFYDDIEDELIEGEVSWESEECAFVVKCESDWFNLSAFWEYEVIGNIHKRDNQ